MAKRRRIDYITKPGKHGTLYLHRIVYRDRFDPDFGTDVARLWAYSSEHAEERFYESDDDEGWEVVEVTRVRER